MLKNLFLTCAVIGLAAGVTASTTFASGANKADQTKSSPVNIQIAQTAPASGKQLYGNYCAQCHGVNGRGDGPVAPALKARPADLTMLSKNNGGKFPGVHVSSILRFGTTVPAHGSSQMPVWGNILGKMDKANPQFSQLRISNLSGYLETIQAK